MWDTPVFDDLQVLPACDRAPPSGGTPDASVGRHLTVDQEDRFSVRAEAIADQRRGDLRMPAPLELPQGLGRSLLLGLGNASAEAQSGFDLDHGCAPELALGVGLGVVFLAPLCPT